MNELTMFGLPGARKNPCGRCGGCGKVRATPPVPPGEPYWMVLPMVTCPSCGGSGENDASWGADGVVDAASFGAEADAGSWGAK